MQSSRIPFIAIVALSSFIVGCGGELVDFLPKSVKQGKSIYLGIVSDYNNNRVLIWKSSVGAVQGPPDLVLGQPDFVSGTANNGGISAKTLRGPGTFCTDGVKLFVPDQLNNRILVWNQMPTQNQQAADLVLGQADFVSSANNTGLTNPTAQTVYAPNWCQIVNNRLFVADTANARILIWNSLPTATQQAADLELGQVSMNTRVQAAGAQGFALTNGVYSDGTKLYVSDSSNYRVLIWNTLPTVNQQPADVVLGQADMASNANGAANIAGQGLLVVGGHLYVVDRGRHRILIWNSIPTTNGQTPDLVLGQINLTTTSANQGGFASAKTLNAPVDISYDGTRLYISDLNNNRILGFNSLPTLMDQAADFVFGQSSMNAVSANQGGSITSQSLYLPHGLLFGTFVVY